MFLIARKSLIRGQRTRLQTFSCRGFLPHNFFFKKRPHRRPNQYQHSIGIKNPRSPFFRYDSPFFRARLVCIKIITLVDKCISIFQNKFGVYYVLPLIDAVEYGHTLHLHKNVLKFFFFISVGSALPLFFIHHAFVISNLGMQRKVLVTSPGTYARIRYVRGSICVLTLPSGKIITVTSSLFTLVGRNGNILTHKQVRGKASTPTARGRRIIVRSVAKNPVDHPNGGRTRGKILFKTP
jgi:hypothetical protein